MDMYNVQSIQKLLGSFWHDLMWAPLWHEKETFNSSQDIYWERSMSGIANVIMD